MSVPADNDNIGEVIRDAFHLRDARGVNLLRLLAGYATWRGDLGEMRDDQPRDVAPAAVHAEDNDDRFWLLMSMAKALPKLQPKCQELLHLYYSEGRSMTDIATTLETTESHARNLVEKCERRA